MIGYDFNGVVDTGAYTPKEGDVIITGNTMSLAPGVIKWLKEHEIEVPVYFNPDENGAYNQTAAGVWKAEMIKRLGVTKFHEDDIIQWQIIKQLCPGVELVKV